MTGDKRLANLLVLALTAAAAAPLAAATAPGPRPAAKSTVLKVYLPRAQKVKGHSLTVGDICIILGDDDARVAKAEQVPLGRAPFSREEMKIDRAMILGRLAASGFAAKDIHFSGAPQVTVSLSELDIDTSRLVAAASALLNQKRPCFGEAQWHLQKQVEPVTIPSGPAVKLSASLAAGSERDGTATVRVNVTREGKAVATSELSFAKSYLWRQVRATKDIPAGQEITKSNVAVECVYRPSPQVGFTSPYGKLARHGIRKGTDIPAGLLETPKPALVFKRNALVRIRVDLGGFSLLAKGMALSDGRVGQVIRVQNIDSKRIVTARVCADGSVQPLLQEKGK